MCEKRFFFTFALVFFVLILAGCKRTQQHDVVESLPVLKQEFVEARLHDVPLLLRATNLCMLHNQQDGDAIILKYTSYFSLADAVIFYEEHMERFGWHKLACFESGQEVLLNYEKPQKYCSISLRIQQNDVCVVIYSAPKTLDYS